MTMGIFVSLLNAIHFKKYINIYAEFVPQMIFLLSLFGYMDFLIFYKWSQDWTGREAPFILNVMIDMFLKPTTMSDKDKLFDGQVIVLVSEIVIDHYCNYSLVSK
jgi:V-type H+-transporting ATPase subunit a